MSNQAPVQMVFQIPDALLHRPIVSGIIGRAVEGDHPKAKQHRQRTKATVWRHGYRPHVSSIAAFLLELLTPSLAE